MRRCHEWFASKRQILLDDRAGIIWQALDGAWHPALVRGLAVEESHADGTLALGVSTQYNCRTGYRQLTDVL